MGPHHCEQCGSLLHEDRPCSRPDYRVYEPCECGGTQCPHLDEDDCCDGRRKVLAAERG